MNLKEMNSLQYCVRWKSKLGRSMALFVTLVALSVTLVCSVALQDFKNIIENIFEKNNLNQFIVVEDTENENTLTIVKEGDIEQFGMYVCMTIPQSHSLSSELPYSAQGLNYSSFLYKKLSNNY